MEDRPTVINPPIELVFSTDTVPERERLAWFREEVCEKLGMAFDHLGNGLLEAFIKLRGSPNLALAMTWSRDSVHIERSRRLIAAGDDEGYSIGIQLDGTAMVAHSKYEYHGNRGSIFCVDRSEVNGAIFPGTVRQLFLTLPRAHLEPILPNPARASAATLPPGFSIARLITAHLHACWTAAGEPRSNGHTTMLQAMGHLMAIALGGSTRKIDGARASLNLAWRELALDLIRHSFTDPRFNARHAAARLGLSRRSLYRLFEEGEMSFSECVRARRLARARRLLSQNQMPVTQAAFAAGFNDLSTFNRAFRAHYGITPREVPLSLPDQAGTPAAP